jgi:hypothetical protein
MFASLEYDGFADFPHYTTNLLSDLNAMVGIFLAHTPSGGYLAFDIRDHNRLVLTQ